MARQMPGGKQNRRLEGEGKGSQDGGNNLRKSELHSESISFENYKAQTNNCQGK